MNDQHNERCVRLSTHNRFDECPVWWQNFVNHVRTHNDTDREVDQQLNMRYNATLVHDQDPRQGSLLLFVNAEDHVRMILEWG